MINEQFFSYVTLLEQKYFKKPQYNLFRVLRSESDEVRLHSRFLADLLNPSGGHHHGDKLLRLFLDKFNLAIPNETTALVNVEYKNIDILIRYNDTAVIVENKIYAGDQKEQLSRYYETMKREGFNHITIIYLTLTAYPASDDSTANLTQDFIDNNLINASYVQDIYELIERYIELSATEASLREALIQYLDIISNLTDKLENKEHMEELKNLLKSGDNISQIPDLMSAYNEVLVDYQLDIWHKIADGVTREFGPLFEDSITEQEAPRQLVKDYVDNRRNSKYLEVSSKLEDYENSYIYIEQDHRIYFGIFCDDGKNSNEYKRIRLAVEGLANAEAWDNMPVAFYVEPRINFKNLNSDELTYLSLESNRQMYADYIMSKLQEIMSLIRQRN
ncbi:PD-(D/E)XK nuclease family protein [Shewanella sp. 5S214]|uniref:PDDEXK-like family protein n=1 Tax=Shewanella sp. 5S214 TaxID=3229999 RepID=UPI00352C4BA7